jgi:hypothetical protein
VLLGPFYRTALTYCLRQASAVDHRTFTGQRVDTLRYFVGSFLCAPNYCRRNRPAARQQQSVDSSASRIGFRRGVRLPPQQAHRQLPAWAQRDLPDRSRNAAPRQLEPVTAGDGRQHQHGLELGE